LKAYIFSSLTTIGLKSLIGYSIIESVIGGKISIGIPFRNVNLIPLFSSPLLAVCAGTVDSSPVNQSFVNSGNIADFMNCRVVEGSVYINERTFTGLVDLHLYSLSQVPWPHTLNRITDKANCVDPLAESLGHMPHSRASISA
jgi:hypothetical protein